MRTKVLLATILLLMAALVHLVGGEFTDIRELHQTNIPDNIKTEIWGVWHMISFDLIFSGLCLLYLLRNNTLAQNKNLIHFIGIRMFIYGIIFLFLILTTNIQLLFMVPQWILLMAIGILLEWNSIFRQGIKKRVL